MRPDLLFRHYLFGLLMGSADVVPGVSGGTMALVVGIYARLIDSIGRAVAAVPLAVRGRPGAAIRSLLSVEWTLVLPLGLGILTAIVVASAFIPQLLEDHPVVMRALFFGLIAGSLTLPWQRIQEHSARTFGLLAVAAVAAFIFSGLPDTEVGDPSMVQVFGSAMLAICAMILPGVSGSFLLLVLGMYEPTLDAVHERDVAYLAVFLAGAVVGISLFAVVLRWLLVHVHDLTMAALVGLMLGSLRALWPFLEDDRGLRLPEEGDPVLLALALGLGGLVFVLGLARLGDAAEAAEESAGVARGR
ncbi:MAG: DUF368 domain-containing protein [Dehalococcoidia bacterium]